MKRWVTKLVGKMGLLPLKGKSSSKFSNIVVILVVVLNIWFTDRVLDIYVITSSEPTILIGAWFAFTGGELWLLSGIKKAKIKKEVIELSTMFSDVQENMKGV